MYSVLLMAAFTAAPDAPAGIIFNRHRGAGCVGTVSAQEHQAVPVQSYALVPVQRNYGCTDGFAAAPQQGCVGGQGASVAAGAPLPQVSLVYVQQPRRFLGYRQVCRGNHCEVVAIYE